MKAEERYLACHKASGFKVGDYVKVTRKATSHEFGWGNGWNPYMCISVGEVLRITSDDGSEGFGLSDEHGLRYPFFVLEQVENPNRQTEVRLSNKYTIVLSEGSPVFKVDCQEFSVFAINDLYRAAKELKLL